MIDILMICHNRLDYTKIAINGVLRQTYKKFNFIIWNNASTDGTQEYLETIKDPRVRVVNCQENKPLAEVINEVVRLSDAKYFGKVDNDTLVPIDWLERLVEVHEKEHLGFIGGFHFRRDDLDNVIPKLTPIAHKAHTEPEFEIWEKPYIGGCAFLIRREDFTEPITIRGEDKRMFMGLSDYQMEFQKRGLKNGYLWSPILWVEHLEDCRSAHFIDSAEHQAYKFGMRGMSLQQNTDENYIKARAYLEINTK